MLRGTLGTQTIAKAVAEQPEQEPYKRLLGNCQLVLEPGRKIVGDAFVLMMRVENQKERESLNECWIMTDGGLNTMPEVKTYHWYFPMICANKLREAHTQSVKIAGPLCESGDVWDYDAHKDLPDYREMPESINPGDYIAMLETGAYGVSQMSRYNGRPMAGVVMIREEGGSVVVTKKSETYEDLREGETSLYDSDISTD